MWLSGKLRSFGNAASETTADLGVTTIGGERTGVYTRGEARDLDICTPGGIVWRPKSGDQVLVLKGGPGGEEAFVLGVRDTGKRNLADGELYFYSKGGASICLRNNGAVEICGDLRINGIPYAPCNCAPPEDEEEKE